MRVKRYTALRRLARGALRRRGRARVLKRGYRRPRFRQPVHSFKRTYYERSAIRIDNTTPTYNGGYVFKLDQVPGYAELTALYDQYRIAKVVFEIIPQFNINALGVSGAPSLHTAIDYDDITAPPNLETLLEYGSYKQTRGTSIHKRILVPRTAAIAFQSATTVGYTLGRSRQWIDEQSPSVPHYGLKLFIQSTVTGGELTCFYDIKVTYYIGCKNVK